MYVTWFKNDITLLIRSLLLKLCAGCTVQC